MPTYDQFLGLALAILAGSPLAGFLGYLWRPRPEPPDRVTAPPGDVA